MERKAISALKQRQGSLAVPFSCSRAPDGTGVTAQVSKGEGLQQLSDTVSA